MDLKEDKRQKIVQELRRLQGKAALSYEDICFAIGGENSSPKKTLDKILILLDNKDNQKVDKFIAYYEAVASMFGGNNG